MSTLKRVAAPALAIALIGGFSAGTSSKAEAAPPAGAIVHAKPVLATPAVEAVHFRYRRHWHHRHPRLFFYFGPPRRYWGPDAYGYDPRWRHHRRYW
jgi:hypothetical protein